MEIGVVSLIISIILWLINLIIIIVWNKKQDKKAKISLNLLSLKRLYQEYYNLLKELTNRMKITDKKEKEDFSIYYFKINKLNADGFVELKEQRTLLLRLKNIQKTIISLVGYKKIGTMDKWERAKVGVVLSPEYITVPHFYNFENPEDLKSHLKSEFKNLAREKGIKLKD